MTESVDTRDKNTKDIRVKVSPNAYKELRKILDKEGDNPSAFFRRCAMAKIDGRLTFEESKYE